jgi:tetratricopeptide (TPR) repeat protein
MMFGQSESPNAQEAEATSLLGKPLYRLSLSPDQKSQLEDNLDGAKADYDKNPRDAENVIWLGRRLAYLWRYGEAIDVYTEGIALYPSNAKLYRHRGHRYITLREFDKAIADLEKAAKLTEGATDEIEPDGAPNPSGQPRSTLQSNIWYHLGLAYYLKGDFANALRSYEACMKVSTVNDDMLVATADWLYMTYRRMGREAEAQKLLELIREDMEILENHVYHQRLLMYKGLVNPDSLLSPADLTEISLITQGYGVANWYFVNGDKDRAKALLEKILQGSYWAAFGYIAAEADLYRWKD